MQTLPFTVLSQYLIQTKVTKKTDKVYQKSLLIKNTYPTEHRHGRDHVAFVLTRWIINEYFKGCKM